MRYIIFFSPSMTARELPNSNPILDQKAWNHLKAQFDDELERCGQCGGILEKVIDPDIGIELVCKNPGCAVNN
jgi:uncharacterized protein with PIN domain